MIPLLVLFVIPWVNLIAPFTWIAFSTWMLAISYVDFPMGNHRLGFAEQRQRLKKRRFAALGFGGATLVAVAIPFINFIAIPAAVAGATAFWVDQLRRCRVTAPTRVGLRPLHPDRFITVRWLPPSPAT